MSFFARYPETTLDPDRQERLSWMRKVIAEYNQSEDIQKLRLEFGAVSASLEHSDPQMLIGLARIELILNRQVSSETTGALARLAETAGESLLPLHQEEIASLLLFAEARPVESAHAAARRLPLGGLGLVRRLMACQRELASAGHGASAARSPVPPLGADPKYFVYQMSYTGLFSMLEQSLLAGYIACRILGSKLLVVPPEDWALPIEPGELLGALGMEAAILPRGAALGDVPVTTVAQIRGWYHANAALNADAFLGFKGEAYVRLASWIEANAARFALPPRPAPGETAVYLRRGDKIDFEEISMPRQSLTELLRAVGAGSAGGVGLISDDSVWLDGLLAELPGNFSNRTLKKAAGWSLDAAQDFDDVRAMLYNFLALGTSSKALGTATSNLVNAAFILRYALGLPLPAPTPLFPTPFYVHI